ncbi:hypothetical protein U1Q18_028518, partial [Sarracenia purpurea var. burkii]
RRPADCVRLSKLRQLRVPALEGARLRTRWASENRLNRGVAEAISEVVFAERRNRTGAEGFWRKKKKETVRRLEGAAISSDLEGFGEAPETVQRALGLQASPSGRIGLKVASGAMDLADGAVGFVIR